MDDQQVLMDTFISRLRLAAAMARGDRTQVERYEEVMSDLIAGGSGHLTAAATGDNLAHRIIENVVTHCVGKFLINGHHPVYLSLPHKAEVELRSYIGELLDQELLPTMKNMTNPTRQMVCDATLAIAMDVCRGANGNAVRLRRTADRERTPSRLRQILEVWPESHWPGFALRQADVLQSYTA